MIRTEINATIRTKNHLNGEYDRVQKYESIVLFMNLQELKAELPSQLITAVVNEKLKHIGRLNIHSGRPQFMTIDKIRKALEFSPNNISCVTGKVGEF